MWGSLRSSSGFGGGVSGGPPPPPNRSGSQSHTEIPIIQGQAEEAGPSSSTGAAAGAAATSSPVISTSFISRHRTSLSSLLSSNVTAGIAIPSTPDEAGAESELDKESVAYIESFFDRYWAELSVFAFERAKDIADKEKELALKSHIHGSHYASSGFTWVILTTAVAQLAITEKGYMNLAFLAPKGFLRKDSNLKTILESIRVDLRKVIDAGVASSPIRHKNSQIATCLTVLINLRLEQMEFYDRLSVFGTSKNVEIGDLISDIEVIYEKFRDEVKDSSSAVSVLSGILKTLQWESEILINLLRAINMMQTWEYLEATIALQHANTQIQEWNEILQNHSTTIKKSSFYNSPPSFPLLFLWIKKLKGALVSKYSLYFYELLVKNSNSTFEMKQYCSKLPVDYFGRMLSFQKKSDALCASIIFDAKDTRYHPDGYICNGREIGSPQGLDSFPAILSIPTKPVVHWPNLVMIISDRLNELNVDKLVGFFDSSMQATYFVQRIDPKMFLTLIYESKKSEKDAYIIKFISDLTMDLKCGRIFSALKTTK